MTKVRRKRKAYAHGSFPSLGTVTSPTVGTNAASYYLNRQPRTLRGWACYENGPIKPINVFGKWHWSVAGIRALLGGGDA